MRRPRYFQWIDGEYKGNVTKLVNITETDGEYFYNFEDGETCNQRFISKMTNNASALKNKFMVEIASPSTKWQVEEIKMGSFRSADNELVDVPPLEDITSASGIGANIDLSDTNVGKTKLVPPAYSGPMYELPNIDDYFYSEEESLPAQPKNTLRGATMKPKHQPQVETTQTPPTTSVPTTAMPVAEYVPPCAATTARYESPLAQNDPIRLLAKTCKKHPTDVDLTLTISLPKKSVFNLAVEEFNDKDGESFINCLIENIDINEIIDALRDSLIAAYTNAEEI